MRHLGSIGSAFFLDCGANFGFWTARVLTKEFGEHEALAVEASQTTFEILRTNLGSDVTLFSAVAKKVGRVYFDNTKPHAARCISPSGASSVPAVTIDSLTAMKERIIIKLDVEGAEAEALAGSQETLKRADVALLYEDHGADYKHATTTAMLASGLRIYNVLADGSVSHLHGLGELRQIKKESSIGYNFVAVKVDGAYDLRLSELARETKL